MNLNDGLPPARRAQRLHRGRTAPQFIDAGMRLIESIERDMIHVRLWGPTRLVVVGAPSYFERKGVPRTRV